MLGFAPVCGLLRSVLFPLTGLWVSLRVPRPQSRKLHLWLARQELLQSPWLEWQRRGEGQEWQELELMKRLFTPSQQAYLVTPSLLLREETCRLGEQLFHCLPGPRPLFWELPEPSPCFHLCCPHSFPGHSGNTSGLPTAITLWISFAFLYKCSPTVWTVLSLEFYACGIHRVVVYSHSSFILLAECYSIALVCLNGFLVLAIKQAMTKEDNEAWNCPSPRNHRHGVRIPWGGLPVLPSSSWDIPFIGSELQSNTGFCWVGSELQMATVLDLGSRPKNDSSFLPHISFPCDGSYLKILYLQSSISSVPYFVNTLHAAVVSWKIAILLWYLSHKARGKTLFYHVCSCNINKSLIESSPMFPDLQPLCKSRCIFSFSHN